LWASYNGSQVTVNWTEPDGAYLYPELVIETYRAAPGGDTLESTTTETFGQAHAAGHSFSVPSITVSGDEVRNVYGYKLTVITHNIAGNAAPVTVKIWNIPGMTNITAANTVEITNAGKLKDLLTAAGSSGKNFVLTADIDLAASSGSWTGGNEWTPVGTGSGANAFQGKFYGNGHTIKGLKIDGSKQYTGLFGYTSGTVSGSGETAVYSTIIRDLKVVLNDTVPIDLSAAAPYMGMVAGFVNLRNRRARRCFHRYIVYMCAICVTGNHAQVWRSGA
jgi:hypothetical protein